MQLTPSKIKLYETCPRKFYREQVRRDVRPKMGEAAQRGIEEHRAFELAIQEGAYDRLPGQYADYVRTLDRTYPHRRLEHRLALDEDMRPCTWRQGWIRGTADALWWRPETGQALIVDWKTGKRYPYHLQLTFYAYCLLAMSETVREVSVLFEWLKLYKRDTERYTREDMPRMARDLVGAAERIEADTTWAPNPSGLCAHYCEVPDCEHRGGGWR